ncbi:MAG TPA: hypothetical protein EYQ31_08005 [Candidatus Handelsmanbacteria bacterium]|nr:hypothetical protein [Candidatus Handelsmanbacteria bacterium]
MATLNRFPLFGLWNRVAATVLKYEEDEAKCIGHGVAVLYAIRAQGGGRRLRSGRAKSGKTIPAGEGPVVMTTDDVHFGDDDLPCTYDDDGHVLTCLVGCQSPQDAAQTAASYDAGVEAKIPTEHIEALTAAMQQLLSTYKPAELQGSLIYFLYNDWKVACKAGRQVDLDKLVQWLQARIEDRR